MTVNMLSGETDACAQALDDEARAWMRRLNYRPTDQDARLLKQWCARSPAHREALARARREWREMAPLGDVYDRLYPRHRDEPVRTRESAIDPRRRLFLGAGLSAAGATAVVATVGPALGLWPSWSEFTADHHTGTGEQLRIALADQVELMLNTQTSLDVRSGAGQQGGDWIHLIAGEAAIHRGRSARPVELIAGAGRIVPGVGRVEVRRAGDRHCVTCTEGDVLVRHPRQNLTLRARERVWYGQASVERVATVALEPALSWQQGVVAFDATPLAEAVAEINRYRPGRVILMNDKLARRRLSGQFDIGALDEAIRLIQQVSGAHVAYLPAGVVVLG